MILKTKIECDGVETERETDKIKDNDVPAVKGKDLSRESF